ncbi:MAG: hypothetical protein M1828_000401 [Chrysothrix sp. TS-e1954]|nr:MAG: hypothetical protein M1828_000401 [Chrysothrix sp. TS-e1954]
MTESEDTVGTEATAESQEIKEAQDLSSVKNEEATNITAGIPTSEMASPLVGAAQHELPGQASPGKRKHDDVPGDACPQSKTSKKPKLSEAAELDTNINVQETALPKNDDDANPLADLFNRLSELEQSRASDAARIQHLETVVASKDAQIQHLLAQLRTEDKSDWLPKLKSDTSDAVSDKVDPDDSAGSTETPSEQPSTSSTSTKSPQSKASPPEVKRPRKRSPSFSYDETLESRKSPKIEEAPSPLRDVSRSLAGLNDIRNKSTRVNPPQTRVKRKDESFIPFTTGRLLANRLMSYGNTLVREIDVFNDQRLPEEIEARLTQFQSMIVARGKESAALARKVAKLEQRLDDKDHREEKLDTLIGAVDAFGSRLKESKE